MHLAPHPSWYLFDADGPAPMRLLTDDGHAAPSLSTTPHGPLAALTKALHATGQHLSKHELRHLELFVALQRWRR